MKNKLDILIDLIEEQELDDTEILYDNPVVEPKTGANMKYYAFTPVTPAQPVKKYSKEQILQLEAEMKAKGRL